MTDYDPRDRAAATARANRRCQEAAIRAAYASPTANPDDAADRNDDDAAECPEHGLTRVVSEQAFTGYAGGRCYVATLACGCTDMDETNDINAAY